MAVANVELYRQGIDAFNRRDMDAFLALAHPGVVGRSRVLAIERDSFEGLEATREWWSTLLDVFPDFTIEIVWVRERGSMTVSKLCNKASGSEGRVPLEEIVWQVCEWRDGKVARWEIHSDEDDALAAAGLSA
jgi:hypothetical protein